MRNSVWEMGQWNENFRGLTTIISSGHMKYQRFTKRFTWTFSILQLKECKKWQVWIIGP